MEQVQVGNATAWTTFGEQVAGVVEWIQASPSASAGVALAGSLIACLAVAKIIAFRHRSRL